MPKFDRLKIAQRVKEELRLRPVRRGLKEKCGDKAFLDPENLKFPIVMPNTKDCSPSCKLLHAAYVRAKEWKYEAIAKKALDLLKKNDCEKELGIDIKKI